MLRLSFCFILTCLFSLLYLCALFISQLDKMGTNVCDKIKEAIMAKATAMESGINIERGTPDIKRAGTKTAKMLKRIKSFGTAISWQASQIARVFVLPSSRW